MAKEKIDMTPHGLAISKYNKHTNTLKRIYEDISNYEDANLLAQLAMSDKEDDELIVIMPGWNKGIKSDKELYNKALQLAEKHKAEII